MRRRIALALSASVVTGCGALIGLGDLDRDECVGEGCRAGSEGGIDPETGKPFVDAGGDVSSSANDGGANDGDAGEGGLTLPICNGLVMWVPFEGSTNKTKPSGASPTLGGTGTATYTAEARYGIAGGAIGQSGTPDSLTYPASWPYSTAGTVSMWIRRGLNGSNCGGTDIAFFSSTIPQKGPRIRCLNGSSYLQLAAPTLGGEVYTYSGSVGSSWMDPPAWNHVAATWESGKARIYLNGTGETGTDYTAQQTGGQPVFGDSTSKPDAIYDDLLVWSRALSPTEINDVKISVKSIGEVCFGP